LNNLPQRIFNDHFLTPQTTAAKSAAEVKTVLTTATAL